MKQHPIYKHLLISEQGEIYSTKTNKYLKTFVHKKGYRVFCTRLDGRKSKAILLRVHRLVAETYIENIHNKPFVNHIDGNKLNNNVNNLEWVSSKENSIHARNLGLIKTLKGEENPTTKLKDTIILEIIKMYIPRHKEHGLRQLAQKYGVSHSTLKRNMVRVAGYDPAIPKGGRF